MKLVIPQDNALDLNGDGRVTVDELVRSTWMIFIQLVVVFGAIALAVVALVYAPAFLKVAVSIIALAALLAFSLGVYRMLRHERLDREAEQEKLRRWEREDYEFDLLRGVSDDARATTLAQAEIDAAALQILRRYYDGKPFTRDAMVGDGLMTAQLWNEANGLLRKRGIRAGRKSEFRPDDFAEAWAIYCEAKLKANQHTVHNGDWREAK